MACVLLLQLSGWNWIMKGSSSLMLHQYLCRSMRKRASCSFVINPAGNRTGLQWTVTQTLTIDATRYSMLEGAIVNLDCRSRFVIWEDGSGATNNGILQWHLSKIIKAIIQTTAFFFAFGQFVKSVFQKFPHFRIQICANYSISTIPIIGA